MAGDLAGSIVAGGLAVAAVSPSTAKARHQDSYGTTIDVSWYPKARGMPLFREAMRCNAGGPPAFDTWNGDRYGLASVHVLDTSPPDPYDWRFLHKGWQGVDGPGVEMLGEIEQPAAREQALGSYIWATTAERPSTADIDRLLLGRDRLAYRRTTVFDPEANLLWVGIERRDSLLAA